MKLSLNNSNNLTSKKVGNTDHSSQGREPAFLRKAGKIAATSLISGLLLLGCDTRESSMVTPSHSPDLNKAPVSLMVRDVNCLLFVGDSETSGLVINNLSEDGTAVVTVRRGDTLWRVDTSGRTEDNRPTKGHLSYDVVDVDTEGVLLRVENINPCEVTCTYFRVNFDGSDTAPRPWAADNSFRTERTDNPNIAKLTLRI